LTDNLPNSFKAKGNQGKGRTSGQILKGKGETAVGQQGEGTQIWDSTTGNKFSSEKNDHSPGEIITDEQNGGDRRSRKRE